MPRLNDLVDAMTLEEQVSLLSGRTSGRCRPSSGLESANCA